MNSPDGLSLREVEREGDRLTAIVDLDAALPYLDHHRPSGQPLFGTVMGIEAMATAASALMAKLRVVGIERVESHLPYLPAPVAPALTVTVERVRDHAGESVVAATLSSGLVTGARLHFRGRVALRHAADPVRCPYLDGATLTLTFAEAALAAHGVDAAEIYDVYFHGPAYRVLGGAAWHGGRLYGRAAAALPGLWGAAAARAHAAPRVIEFALQSAGLYAVAAGNRLLIPHRLRRISWTAEVGDIGGAAMWSVAAPANNAPDGPLDVAVYDEQGRIVLRVAGYETVPLPFDRDETRVRALGDRLRIHGQ